MSTQSSILSLKYVRETQINLIAIDDGVNIYFSSTL